MKQGSNQRMLETRYQGEQCFKVAKYSFDNLLVDVGWGVHELTQFVYCKQYIWSSQSIVLKGLTMLWYSVLSGRTMRSWVERREEYQ